MNRNKGHFDYCVKNVVSAHPYLILVFACLLVNSLFTMNASHSLSAQGLWFLLALAGIGSLCYFIRKPKIQLTKRDVGFIVFESILLILIGILFLNSTHPVVFLFLIEAAALITIAYYLKTRNRLSTNTVLLLMAAASFLVHVMYILYTPYTLRQHDSNSIGCTAGGHLAYIEYFLNHSFRLADFNPLSAWQFYQPPLHPFLAAVWVKINLIFGMDLTQAVENIQVLTLFYFGCIVILCYRILKEFDLKKYALIIPIAIICFQPAMIILSGSINNDILCLTLMLAALLQVIRWYKNPQLKTILLAAAFLGFSMMAKLSGVLIAPAIAFLFVAKLFQTPVNIPKTIGQYFLFGVVSIPLGIWWSIYTFIRFKMPLGYVPKLSPAMEQYIGDYSIAKRLFDTDPKQVQSIFYSFGNGFRDHNIFITTLKGSVFDEFTLAKTPTALFFCELLFYVNVVLVLISIVCLVVFLIQKNPKIRFPMKLFLLTVIAASIASYTKFCFDFPHVCTQSFRYIVISFLINYIVIGFVIDAIERKKTKAAKAAMRLIQITTALYCISSVIVYTNLGW